MKIKEATPTSIAVVFGGILITWMVVMKLVKWVWLKPKQMEKWLRQNGFSGNSYRFLSGDMKEMYSMTREARARVPINLSHDIVPRILPFEHHIIQKYGKKSFIWNGPTPSINITDPKLTSEIFFKHHVFQKPNVNPISKLFVRGMVTYEGEQWFKVRKIANPAFHLHKLKNMIPKIYVSCNDMIMRWKLLIANHESHEVDVWPHIQTLTADVISRTAFGSSFEDGRKIFELLKEQTNHVMHIMQSVYIPGWRFLPTKTNRKMRTNYNEIRELIKGIMIKREEAPRDSHGVESNMDDLLGMLMESNGREIGEHGKRETGMSVEEVIEECKLFYIAGNENTASLLLWTLVLLCMHPHWQALARQEALQIVGKDKPKFDDLNHLKVITKILYEVLQLYSPVSSLSRITSRQTKLGEIDIPIRNYSYTTNINSPSRS